ncbi:MAG TPA: hypothetical protein VFF13_03790 [archaeon]|nr:hypothetical protein [archaeon]
MPLRHFERTHESLARLSGSQFPKGKKQRAFANLLMENNHAIEWNTYLGFYGGLVDSALHGLHYFFEHGIKFTLLNVPENIHARLVQMDPHLREPKKLVAPRFQVDREEYLRRLNARIKSRDVRNAAYIKQNRLAAKENWPIVEASEPRKPKARSIQPKPRPITKARTKTAKPTETIQPKPEIEETQVEQPRIQQKPEPKKEKPPQTPKAIVNPEPEVKSPKPQSPTNKYSKPGDKF